MTNGQDILLKLNMCTVSYLIIKPTRCTNFSNLFWNETSRVSFQNKFEKLVHLVGFIIRFIMINDRMNIKHIQYVCSNLAGGQTVGVARCLAVGIEKLGSMSGGGDE